MPVTIKCPDCGHTEQSEDGASKTCPECEGTMVAPAKKKYQAKSTSLEDEQRAKKKSKRRDGDDDDDRPRKKPVDDEDDEPKAKKKPRDDEEEDEKPKARKKDKGKKSGGPTHDGKAAEDLGISPGFKNKQLMAQVEEELDSGEVLHWAGRMCPELVKKGGTAARIFGFIFAGMGLLFCVLVLALAPGMVKAAAVIPLVFVGIGIAVAVWLPGAMSKQAARGWYAVTDERAIVYTPSLFGSGGKAETYEPRQLRKMRVKRAKSPSGAGDLIFKTTYHTVVTSTGRGNTRTEEREVHHGFLSIENVHEVETLIHKVLLGDLDDDEDD